MAAALNDVAVRGRVGARDRILAGPRGIGKTAVLLAFGDICRDQGYEVVNLQAAAGSAGLVDSLLAEAQERVEAGASAWQRAKRGFDRIAGVNVSAVGFGGGISTHEPRDRAASVSASSLARALSELAEAVGQDAPGGGVLITIDEMQVAAPDDLALLAAALQRLNADHPGAGVLFAGSGLPHMSEVLRQARVTHPDGLFDIRRVPLTLSPEDTRYALIEPAQRLRQVRWEPEAADMIVDATNGYPAHLQLFADHAWRAARPDADTITVADAQHALTSAAEEIEERTLGPRLDRLTDRQAELLAAVAVHGGAVITKDLTSTLQRESSTNYSRTRDELITEGDLYAPRRGALALTVPLMRPYLLAHYDEICARANVAILPRQRRGPAAKRAAARHRPAPADRLTITAASPRLISESDGCIGGALLRTAIHKLDYRALRPRRCTASRARRRRTCPVPTDPWRYSRSPGDSSLSRPRSTCEATADSRTAGLSAADERR